MAAIRISSRVRPDSGQVAIKMIGTAADMKLVYQTRSVHQNPYDFTSRYRSRQQLRMAEPRAHRTHCLKWCDSSSGCIGRENADSCCTVLPYARLKSVSAASSPSLIGLPRKV